MREQGTTVKAFKSMILLGKNYGIVALVDKILVYLLQIWTTEKFRKHI